MRFLFTGSRSWNNPHLVQEHLREIKAKFPDAVIVHGDHWAGLDHHVDLLARREGFEVEPHPAAWKRYGRSAGPIRNAEMLQTGVDAVLAYKDDFDVRMRYGGTENCVDLAMRAGVPVDVYRSDGTLYVLTPPADRQPHC